MAGISSKAIMFDVSENKNQKFQEQPFDDDLDLNWYGFKCRTHDPQIGRFLQIDPLFHDYRYNSTYSFSENRVINGREVEGLEYVSIDHYADGTTGTTSHYKSSDKAINANKGTTSGSWNSASYGPLGKGVVHYYYNSNNAVIPEMTSWEQRQTGDNSDIEYHGLYSGPGSITKDGIKGSNNYDFTFQPIDWANAIAKRYDMDYAVATATGEQYVGYLEDVRTLQADKDMVARVNDLLNIVSDPFQKNNVDGVETPVRTSNSSEMVSTLTGQYAVIGALVAYKQWKIDNRYGNKDTFDKLGATFKKDNWINWKIISTIIK